MVCYNDDSEGKDLTTTNDELYELPHPIRREKNYGFMYCEPF